MFFLISVNDTTRFEYNRSQMKDETFKMLKMWLIALVVKALASDNGRDFKSNEF